MKVYRYGFTVFLLSLIMGIFATSCDDLISNFQDEDDFSMQPADQEAVNFLKRDSVYTTKESASMVPWTYRYQKTFSIDEILTEYFNTVFDTTFYDPVTDSVEVDTLHLFAFTSDYSITDTTEFHLTSGEVITLYYDSTFTFQDTIRDKGDTVQFTREFQIEKSYPLDYFLTEFSTGEKDTLPKESIGTILDSLTADSASITVPAELYKIAKAPGINYYLKLEIREQKKETLFFLDNYVTISIVNAAGDTLNPASIAVPPEVFAGAYEFTADQEFIPLVKTRYVFKLSPGDYLIKMDKTDQTRARDLLLAITTQ